MWSGFNKSNEVIADECQVRLGGETLEETIDLPHVQSRIREHRRAKYGALLIAVGTILSLH